MTKMKLLIIVLSYSLFFSCKTDLQRKAVYTGYADLYIMGWTLRVNNEALEDPYLKEEGLKELKYQLMSINRMMNKDQLANMQKVLIWVEKDKKVNNEPNALYHPSKEWLLSNGYNSDKAKCIEIPDLKVFIKWSLEGNALILFHELCHAYHDQFIGFDNPHIIEAYNRAKLSGKYEKVLYQSGKYLKHYALVNELEYFAECSEAYLRINDYYPFNNAELKKFDLPVYLVLEKIWGPTGKEKAKIYE